MVAGSAANISVQIRVAKLTVAMGRLHHNTTLDALVPAHNARRCRHMASPQQVATLLCNEQ
jgi:hypothetical protein